MSGRNPALSCTLTSIAIAGTPDKNNDKRDHEPGSSIFLYLGSGGIFLIGYDIIVNFIIVPYSVPVEQEERCRKMVHFRLQYRAAYSERVFISHHILYITLVTAEVRYRTASGDVKYVFGSKIETGTEKTTIIDIFNIIQKQESTVVAPL